MPAFHLLANDARETRMVRGVTRLIQRSRLMIASAADSQKEVPGCADDFGNPIMPCMQEREASLMALVQRSVSARGRAHAQNGRSTMLQRSALVSLATTSVRTVLNLELSRARVGATDRVGHRDSPRRSAPTDWALTLDPGPA